MNHLTASTCLKNTLKEYTNEQSHFNAINARKKELERHANIQHSAKQKINLNFHCELCNKTFCSIQGLRNHIDAVHQNF